MVGSANADRGGRGSYQIILFVRAADDAGNGAETAAQQRKGGTFRSVFLAGVTIGVETHVGIGAHSDESPIHHLDLSRCAGRRDYPVAFVDRDSFLRRPRLAGAIDQFYLSDYKLHVAREAERGTGITGEKQGGKGLERIFPGKRHGIHLLQEII